MKILVTGAFLFFYILSSASFSETEKCVPDFPYKGGWLGGDAAYSLKMSNGKNLWLFGDTFIGKNHASRAGSAMPANTIGISECNTDWQIEYFWKKGEKPEAFFKSTPGEVKDWPLHAFEYNCRLYIFLEQVENDPSDGLGFKTAGVKVTEVTNPYESPEKWQVTYHDLVSDGTVFPGVATVKQKDYVYMFSVLDSKEHKVNHPMILMRLPVNSLSEPKNYLEYLADNGNWKKGANWQDARIIMDTGATEMSVAYNHYLKKWLALYKDTVFLSRNVVVRMADNLEGPWSDEKLVYQFPEMIPGNEKYDSETFCYAAKEHQQFSSGKSIVFTYACNSFNFGKLVNNLDIYVPKTVVLDLAKLK